MQAHLSARILATDREEAGTVRPVALGNIHTRQVSNAVGHAFQIHVGTALDAFEHSWRGSGGAECVHKTVILDLDRAPNRAKLALNCSNAHNEF